MGEVHLLISPHQLSLSVENRYLQVIGSKCVALYVHQPVGSDGQPVGRCYGRNEKDLDC